MHLRPEKMKTCWLHIGFHKTASTSFQQTCKANIKILRDLGFHYPLFSRISFPTPRNQTYKKNVANHSTTISSLFLSKPLKFRGNLVIGINNEQRLNVANQIWKNELESCLNTDSDLIISGESISTLPTESILKLVDLISSCGFTVRPFGLVRSPYSALCSGLQERIKAGQYCPIVQTSTKPSQKFIAEMPLPKKSHCINNLVKIFSNELLLSPFSAACASSSNGPVAYLFRSIGINDMNNFSIVKSNESKSNGWVRITNLINKKYPKFRDGSINEDYFLPSLDWSNTGKFYLTKPEYQEIKSIIKEENMEITRLLDSSFVDEKISFSEKLPDEELTFMAFEEINNIMKSRDRKIFE